MKCVSCEAELNPDDFPIKRIGTKYKCPVCKVEAKIGCKIPCYTEGYGIFPDKEGDEFVLRYFKIIRRYNTERGIYDEIREEMRENFCNGYVYTKQFYDGTWWGCTNNRHYYYQYSNMGKWQGFGFTPRADYQRLYTASLSIYAKGTQYEKINLREFFNGIDYKKWWTAYSNMFDLMNYSLFVEYMQKVGLNNLLREWRDEKFGDVDYGAKKLREMLNITQPQYKELLAKGDRATAEDIKRYRLINKWGLKTDEEWEVFNRYLRNLSDYNIKKFFELFPFTLHKFCRYIEKQGNEFNMGIYLDYLELAKKLNLDLKDTFVTFPDYLKEKHNDLVDLYQERQFDAKLIKYANKANESANRFAPVVERTNKWCSADEQFVVVNPKSPQEIGYEGLKLRHCVAMYIDNIVKGEKNIMFLRKANEPDVPYYTMEIIGDTISQCKGYRNTNRTEDVDVFLHKYAKKMNLKITDNEAYQAFV